MLCEAWCVVLSMDFQCVYVCVCVCVSSGGVSTAPWTRVPPLRQTLLGRRPPTNCPLSWVPMRARMISLCARPCSRLVWECVCRWGVHFVGARVVCCVVCVCVCRGGVCVCVCVCRGVFCVCVCVCVGGCFV